MLCTSAIFSSSSNTNSHTLHTYSYWFTLVTYLEVHAFQQQSLRRQCSYLDVAETTMASSQLIHRGVILLLGAFHVSDPFSAVSTTTTIMFLPSGCTNRHMSSQLIHLRGTLLLDTSDIFAQFAAITTTTTTTSVPSGCRNPPCLLSADPPLSHTLAGCLWWPGLTRSSRTRGSRLLCLGMPGRPAPWVPIR